MSLIKSVIKTIVHENNWTPKTSELHNPQTLLFVLASEQLSI